MTPDVEVVLLRGFLTPSEAPGWRQSISGTAEASSLLDFLLDGDFQAVLRSPQVSDLLAGDGSCSQGGDIEAHLERRVLFYLTGGSKDGQPNRELVAMAMAVSCLHLFVQSNWTGPPVSIQISELLPPALLSSQARTLDETIHSSLLLDGESVYSLVANPFLLLLARVVLTRCSSEMSTLQLLPWWTLRYVRLHQHILEACSPQLLGLAQSSVNEVMKLQSVLSEQRALAVQFHLEGAYVSLTYYEYQQAKKHVQEARELSGLDVNVTGALGKRTSFQEKFLAQMILEVKRTRDGTDPESSPTPTPLSCLPKDLSLDDDTMLDAIKLAEPNEYDLPDLSAEEQAVILGVCVDFQKNNPVHKLTAEELLAFTSCILSQPKFWGIQVAALCLRTKLEKGKSRCVERAMTQSQVIVDHFEDEKCPVTERLKVFYCCQAPPRWDVQKQLASLLIDLGCTSSALLLYEKLALWEDVVICYERLGQHGKAEEILRRELEKEETPSLYCLLGDVLREHQYYDRAWVLSRRRSARAMRSKALLHLHNNDIRQCIDCFELSLKINRMQLGVWFSLGCAYLALEAYDGAAKAFQQCVLLEPDNAEAWNNLSTAHIRLQKKHKAFRTLQEALKCNYEHWQIWDNFIYVCIDIGEFSETIKAYHRLMDLRENFKDVQILRILVRSVVENLPDRLGGQAATVGPKLKELLGRVTSRNSNEAEIWRQYALLYGGGRSSDPEDNEKALQFLSKAHRCEVQAGDWEKDPGLFKEVIKRAMDMGEVTIGFSKKKKSSTEAVQMLSSTRLSLRSLATKAKQMHADVATGQVHAELQDGVAALEQLITELQELSGTLRSQSQ
ncbi:tetratricopeptide repeat protein 27 [Brachionichthys hirsutus]|uniref:tetratricopeptide repeat protein 27 n=1 Tax=Brachionichthys hirsutus TaxID=412623 RepID=UPI0036045442